MLSALILLTAATYASPHYDSRVLYKVVDEVQEAASHDQRPVVIFDLDDTLVNSLTRTLRILRDFVELEGVREHSPEAAHVIDRARVSDLGYYVDESLRKLGVTDEEFIAKAKDFWMLKYFSNEYCGDDRPEAGAAAYARKVHELGAKIVYLTGRDRPRMRACTRENLLKNHFPTGEGVVLMMKPNKDIDDVEFKVKAFEKIRAFGKMVAGFENEPRNINEMQKAYPGATMVFMDTIHSNKPDVPGPTIHWIHDFRPRD